jgi:hypothetical protein
MKILAFYDIHGNPDALDALIGDPRAEGADVVSWAATLFPARELVRPSIV